MKNNIRLTSILPRLNLEAIKNIEETAQFLAVQIPKSVLSSQETIEAANLQFNGLEKEYYEK